MEPAGGGFKPCGLLRGDGPLLEHHRDGESVGMAVRNSPDYLRRCFINNRWLYDAGRFRDLMETGMSSVLASSRLPATMKFDLAGTRCVNEYDGVNPPFFRTGDDGDGPPGGTREGAAAAPGADIEMEGDPSADTSQA